MRRKKNGIFCFFKRVSYLCSLKHDIFETIYRGVEQWQLVGLITQRS